MWQTAESLDELREDLRFSGLQSPVTLAIDPVSFRCTLQDGNHRMTCATELNLMWIPARVLRLSLGLANNYLKVLLKFLNLFLIYRVHVNLDLRHFERKKAKTIVSIAKVSGKLIHALKLLALVCQKYV